MNDVIRELDKIKNWDRDARLIPLSQTALAGIEKLQHKALAAKQVIDANSTARIQREEAIKHTEHGVLDWLYGELEKTSAIIANGGALLTGVRRASGHDGPRIDDYIPKSSVELWVRNPHGSFQPEHVLRFAFCTKFTVTVRVIQPGTLVPEERESSNAEIAVLPGYTRKQIGARPNQNDDWHLLTRQGNLHQVQARPVSGTFSGIRQPARTAARSEPVSISCMRFSTTDWPILPEQLEEFCRMALDVFVTQLAR